MRYRDAKKLHNKDEVIRKSDKVVLTVLDIEVYGVNMVVRVNCVEPGGAHVSIFHNEIE
jgi:hypothetical protein